ncbi:MAG: hypothetical protein Q4P28_03630 [Tissierellia bacterium]|nr:hypothetical protein [Tissierellia bacterium]
MNNNFKYEPLTPRRMKEDDEKYLVYRDALNQAYSNNEVKNIAISGIYGSGKSSVWKTYEYEKVHSDNNNWTEDNVIIVALSEFKEGTDNETGKDSKKTDVEKVAYKKRINKVEEQIINQILYQVDSAKIPFSKYEIKKTDGYRLSCGVIAKLISFCIGISLLINRREILGFIPENIQLFGVFGISLISTLTIIIPILIGAKKLISKEKLNFTKLSIQGNSMELKDSQKDILNDEMRELVYIIKASGIHTIVFEDLDRFDNLDLFIRLRELNYLVNANSTKIVRFIYLLRDDLFVQQERTKFFDLIIPVVPIINAQNSSGMMIKLFGSIKDNSLRPSIWLLESISLYIADMRMLYSIRNEYEVYSNAIGVSHRELDPDKLLGIITFKNLFPQEFDLLQQNKGYVYRLLQNLDIIRKNLIKKLEKKIDDLEGVIEKIKLLTANTKYELMGLYIPNNVKVEDNESLPWPEFLKNWHEKSETSYTIISGRSRTGYTFDTFYESVFTSEDYKKKEKLFKDIDKKESIKLYESEISELNNEIVEIYTCSISEILSQMDEVALEDFFYMKTTDEQKLSQVVSGKKEGVDLSLLDDHYFGFIRFLLYSGLLDKTYPYYLGYFYESTIGLNDEIYIRKLRDGTASDEHFELNHPEIVKDKLKNMDYKKRGIYNQSLILAILEDEKDKNHFTQIVDVTLKNENKHGSFFSFLDSLNNEQINQAVRKLLKTDFDLFWKLLETSNTEDSIHDKMLVKIFQNIRLLKEDKNKYNKLREYTRIRSNLLTKNELVDNNSFYAGLEEVDVQFDDITDVEINSAIASKIEKRGLYLITIPNIATIYHLITGTPYNDSIVKLLNLLETDEILKDTKSRMSEDVEIYTKEYIEVMNNLKKRSNSTEKTFLNLLNMEISSDIKTELIRIEESNISNINQVEDKNLWSLLLESERVIFTVENMASYYEYAEADQFLIKFLNTNSNNPLIKKISVDLANDILQDEEINESVFNVALNRSDDRITNLNNKLFSDDNLNRVIRLIQKQKLDLTKENYLAIQSIKDDVLLVKYLKDYKDTLDSFIGTTVLMESEVTEEAFILMLDNRLLDIELSRELLDEVRESLSVLDIPNAYLEIREYVFDNYFDEEDIQKIIDYDKDFDLWDDFMIKINNNSQIFESILSKDLNSTFITKLIQDKTLHETKKIALLTKLVEQKQFARNWQKWMNESSSGVLNKLSDVLNGNKRPKYSEMEEIENLVDALVNLEVLTRSRSDDTLYFKGSNLKKLYH